MSNRVLVDTTVWVCMYRKFSCLRCIWMTVQGSTALTVVCIDSSPFQRNVPDSTSLTDLMDLLECKHHHASERRCGRGMPSNVVRSYFGYMNSRNDEDAPLCTPHVWHSHFHNDSRSAFAHIPYQHYNHQMRTEPRICLLTGMSGLVEQATNHPPFPSPE